MSSLSLHSCLAPYIERFIRLRQLSGTDYHSQAQLLGYFDRFLVEQGVRAPRITREIIDAYQQRLACLHPRGQANRLCVVRQLCAYLARTDPCSYVPEPLRIRPSDRAHPPYIYSPSQLQALLAAAAALTPPNSLRPHTYYTLPPCVRVVVA